MNKFNMTILMARIFKFYSLMKNLTKNLGRNKDFEFQPKTIESFRTLLKTTSNCFADASMVLKRALKETKLNCCSKGEKEDTEPYTVSKDKKPLLKKKKTASKKQEYDFFAALLESEQTDSEFNSESVVSSNQRDSDNSLDDKFSSSQRDSDNSLDVEASSSQQECETKSLRFEEAAKKIIEKKRRANEEKQPSKNDAPVYDPENEEHDFVQTRMTPNTLLDE